jgi:NAD(P)-dependent dehydrogenase (short-subunit alcohol dehydrogenase family)
MSGTTRPNQEGTAVSLVGTDTTIALITGANKGIGLETARQLGQLGMHVLIGARTPELGSQAAAQLQTEGIQADALALDVTDEASVADAAAWIETTFGRLDVLVNNAAIGGGTWAEQTTVDELNRLFDTNLYGVLRVTNALLPLLRKSAAPRIVNVSSGVASLTQHADPTSFQRDLHLTAYSVSKSALNALTLSYAKELKDDGFKVNVVDPGYCRTDFNGGEGFQSAADGAVPVVRYATVDADGPTATFGHADGVVDW